MRAAGAALGVQWPRGKRLLRGAGEVAPFCSTNINRNIPIHRGHLLPSVLVEDFHRRAVRQARASLALALPCLGNALCAQDHCLEVSLALVETL